MLAIKPVHNFMMQLERVFNTHKKQEYNHYKCSEYKDLVSDVNFCDQISDLS